MNFPPDDADAEHDPIEEVAMNWLLERDDGFAPGRAAEFEAWRRRDARHATAVERLEQTWSRLEELASPAMTFPPLPGASSSPRISRRLLLWPALAAAAVLVLAFGWWRAGSGNLHAQYATTPGSVQRILLPDGTVVTLNGESAAEVNYAGDERRVRLGRGEAHFDVAHDPARPFLVTAGGITVRVVGTAFNVRVATAVVEVVVASGQVRVTAPENGLAQPGSGRTPTPLLEKGDRVVVPRTGHEALPAVTRLDPEQLRAALAWQQERLVFADTPLREVVDQFNRRNVVQVRFGDEQLGARLVGGTFAANNVEAFVSLLERGGDLTVERRGEREIILRRVR
jgi:transmembrane sensor